MHHALITGLSKPIYSRLGSLIKSNVSSFKSGWNVRIVTPPVSSHALPFQSNLKELDRLLLYNPDAYGNDGPHVLAFNPSDKDQDRWINENVVPYFRFRWLDNALIRRTQKEDLICAMENINTVLAEEEKWCAQVKPQEVSSPLLLPEKQFCTQGQHQALWKHAREADDQRIDNFPNKVSAFRQYHLRKVGDSGRIWVDDHEHAFDWRGPKHAKAPPPRCWKFSFLLPTGFHFDVRSTRAQFCTMTGSDGLQYSKSYLNIDPHGYIRA